MPLEGSCERCWSRACSLTGAVLEPSQVVALIMVRAIRGRSTASQRVPLDGAPVAETRPDKDKLGTNLHRRRAHLCRASRN